MESRDRRRGRAGRTKFVVLTEKRKPERRDRTAAPRPEATPPAMRHRTATQPFGAKKMQLRQSKCSTYDDVAFTLPIVAFTLSGDRFAIYDCIWSFRDLKILAPPTNYHLSTTNYQLTPIHHNHSKRPSTECNGSCESLMPTYEQKLFISCVLLCAYLW